MTVRGMAVGILWMGAACTADVTAILEPPLTGDAALDARAPDAGDERDAGVVHLDARPRRDASVDAGPRRDAAPDPDVPPLPLSINACPFSFASVDTTLRYCSGDIEPVLLSPDSLAGELRLDCGGPRIALSARVLTHCVELVPSTPLPPLSTCIVSGELRVGDGAGRTMFIGGHSFETDTTATFRLGPPIANLFPTYFAAPAIASSPTVVATTHTLAGSLAASFMRAGDNDLRWSVPVSPAAPINHDLPGGATDGVVVRAAWASSAPGASATPSLWLATWDLASDRFDPGAEIRASSPGINLRRPQIILHPSGAISVFWTQTCASTDCAGLFAMTSTDGGQTFGEAVRLGPLVDPELAIAPLGDDAIIGQRGVETSGIRLELSRLSQPGGPFAIQRVGFNGAARVVAVAPDQVLIAGDDRVLIARPDGTLEARFGPVAAHTDPLPGGGLARFTGRTLVEVSDDLGLSYRPLARFVVSPPSERVTFPITAWVSDERQLYLARDQHRFATPTPGAGVDCHAFGD